MIPKHYLGNIDALCAQRTFLINIFLDVFIFFVHRLCASFAAVPLGCCQELPCCPLHLGHRPVAREDALHRSVHALDAHRKLPSMPCFSPHIAVPWDIVLLLHDPVGEYAVCCKRTVPIDKGSWNVMFSVMKQVLAGEPRLEPEPMESDTTTQPSSKAVVHSPQEALL